jgi:hypothetical protein
VWARKALKSQNGGFRAGQYYALMKLDLFWKYEPKKSKAELKELDEYTVLAKGLLEVGDSWYDDYLALAKGE